MEQIMKNVNKGKVKTLHMKQCILNKINFEKEVDEKNVIRLGPNFLGRMKKKWNMKFLRGGSKTAYDGVMVMGSMTEALVKTMAILKVLVTNSCVLIL